MIARVALLAALLVAAPAHAQLLSPGALSRAHAELEGDTHCNDCHASGRRVSEGACNRCHDDVGATLRAQRGLHGRQYRGRDCGGCHVEHRGSGTALIRWPSGSAERFDHDLVGWALGGGHGGLECRDCHDRRNRRGARTYLGLSTACNSCHSDDDPHGGRFGTNCQSCHQVSRWNAVSVSEFDHSLARFQLRGAHQRVECAGCHHTPPRYRGIEFGSCTSCHQDPHAGRNGADCARCHTETSWSELGAMRQNHPGLRLSNGHRSVGCERCHDAGVDEAPSRGSRCVSCHRDVHEADFGNRCESCHASIVWAPLPRAIGLRAHARTAFPLRGEHESAECSSCHSTEQPRHRRYRELVFDGCNSCHADRHEGEFASRQGGECGQCHDERGFAPTLFGAALHASTSFALEGRHQSVACSGCHRAERPRLDWHVEGGHRCEDCHQNPHGDQFATEMASGGCAGCHSAAGWDRPNIDHSTWPLTGVHDLVACSSCHSPTEEDRRTGRGASYRGVARECAGCHEDEHAGQFRLTEPRRECEVCHDTSGFAIEAFDHQRLANYALVGRHAQAECAACHRSTRLESGEEAVRWRLGYRECSDCHADPHAGAQP